MLKFAGVSNFHILIHHRKWAFNVFPRNNFFFCPLINYLTQNLISSVMNKLMTGYCLINGYLLSLTHSLLDNATKFCNEDGTWDKSVYDNCLNASPHPVPTHDVEHNTLIYCIGYLLSIIVLSIAVIIFLTFKWVSNFKKFSFFSIRTSTCFQPDGINRKCLFSYISISSAHIIFIMIKCMWCFQKSIWKLSKAQRNCQHQFYWSVSLTFPYTIIIQLYFI